jgi:hypothetical protein
MSRMDRNTSSAFLGSFQKSWACVSSSFSWMVCFFFSTSKEPPQGIKPLVQVFVLFICDHFGALELQAKNKENLFTV